MTRDEVKMVLEFRDGVADFYRTGGFVGPSVWAAFTPSIKAGWRYAQSVFEEYPRGIPYDMLFDAIAEHIRSMR